MNEKKFELINILNTRKKESSDPLWLRLNKTNYYIILILMVCIIPIFLFLIGGAMTIHWDPLIIMTFLTILGCELYTIKLFVEVRNNRLQYVEEDDPSLTFGTDYSKRK